ncbi:MAG: ABC transporter ATP-binding protein, partial [Lachnospiraceae bacterium]|nr:ABC transporter ATP-binding protein [Lachnospiraceae bacterium]
IYSLYNGVKTTLANGLLEHGGESQKVAVARAFYRKCPVKIFDEPSSALDPIAEYEPHRLSSVKNVDCVLMLEQGRLIERGLIGS